MPDIVVVLHIWQIFPDPLVDASVPICHQYSDMIGTNHTNRTL
jgi:hypothetical protein